MSGIIFVICLLSYLNHSPDHYAYPDYDYVYPDGVQALGWLLELFPIALVLLSTLGIVGSNLWHGRDVSFLRAGPLMTPSAAWGPREDRPRPGKEGTDNAAYSDDVTTDME